MQARTFTRRGVAAVAFALLFAMVAQAAWANLPRTYRSQAIPASVADFPLYQQGTDSTRAGDRLGDGLVNGGDVNRDGKDDVLVGIDEHGGVSGKVLVVSGADGSLIRSILPPDDSTGGRPTAWGTFVGKIADLGSCPGFTGAPGDDCTAAALGAPTGSVPDHIVGAVGVDLPALVDAGMVYVVDGETGAVLKRIVMPPADRAHQAGVPTPEKSDPRTGFGGTVLAPSGLPPCAGNGGIGACDAVPEAVRIGDVDGGGAPDIVVGARSYHDTPASNPVCDPAPCTEAGRFYVYRGEDVSGSDPATTLETPLYTIRNPLAQTDDPSRPVYTYREAMGYSVAPLGDVGRCDDGSIAAGAFCPTAKVLTAPDGRPEWVASVHRADMFGMYDTGVAFVIDGRTGTITNTLMHPEPQSSSIFAFSNYNQPAVGDLASNAAPDVYQGAMVQNVQFRAQGRGYVLNGDPKFGGANHSVLAVLNDPTPSKIGNFGTSSAGIGDVAGDPRKEIMVGAYGPHAPQVVEDVVNDVHIFSPVRDAALQTISSPDQQAGSGFGRALAPMGDLNDDGFLDFAVGAGGYDETAANQGRIYLMRSDNSPAPAAGAPAAGQGEAAQVLAGRAIELTATRTQISLSRGGKPRKVQLKGLVEAFVNQRSCEKGQEVLLQRRKRAGGLRRYRTFDRARTAGTGIFRSKALRVKRTYFYRAVLPQTSDCLPAVSNRVRVTVRRTTKRSEARRDG